MEIAIVSPYLTVGGGENYSFCLAEALTKKGHFVTYFTNAESSFKPSNDNKRLKMQYLKCTVLPIDPSNPISLSLMKELAKGAFDVIHIHQMYKAFNLVSSLSGKLKKTPTVLTDHGGGWLLAAIPHICANLPDSFAAVSDFSLQKMLGYAPKKRARSRVVYGGVKTDVFHPQKTVLRERLNLADDYLILCLGRLLPHKGVDVLIKALKHVPQNTRLLVGGQILDQQYFAYLKNLAEQDRKVKVTFLGKIDDNTMPDLYNLCDIFVQPSVYVDYLGKYHRYPELLGLAKLEAMACAKPVVVSSVGGLPEMVTEGENGFVFESGNEGQLAEHLNLLLSDADLRKKIGENGKATVERELTWEKTATRVVDVYNSLLTN